MPSFSQRSLSNLSTCHPELQRLLGEAIKHVDFTVLEGHRGREGQEKAFREGNSRARWGQSKHNAKPSLAVDIVPWPIDWNDHERFHHLAGWVLGIASQMGIDLGWGGLWTTLVDMPHFELLDYRLEDFLPEED